MPASTIQEIPPGTPRRMCMAAASLLGLALAGYLLYLWVTGERMLGCSARSSCDRVLTSAWSSWLGVPVAAPAALLWLFMLVCATRGWLGPLRLAALTAAAAGIWFVYVQMARIQAWCPWCMAAHGLAFVMVILALWRIRQVPWGGIFCACLLVAVLAIGQIAAPKPPPQRLVIQGGLAIDVARYPILGDPAAEHVFVFLYDYTCPLCLQMHPLLEDVGKRYDGRIAIALAPAPLDAACNPHIESTGEGNQHGCAMAQLVVGLWRQDPAALPVIDRHLAQQKPPRLQDVTAFAREKFGQDAVAAAMGDPAARAFIRAQCNLSQQIGEQLQLEYPESIPKLILGDGTVITGPVPNPKDLYNLIENDLGLAPVESTP